MLSEPPNLQQRIQRVSLMQTHVLEEMVDSMLWDSPIPETEEEKKRQEEVLTGKPVVPSPLGLDSPLI